MIAAVPLDERQPFQRLAERLRERAWELALEAVEDGTRDHAVPHLEDLDPLEQVGDIPAFIGELAREIADPQPERLDLAGPLLELARAHARKREAFGFTPREVLTEFQLLRRVLWDAVSQEQGRLDTATTLAVQTRLDSAFDTLVVEFAVAFFERATKALAEQARTDALTGLLNHQAFWSEVAHELRRAERYGHTVTLVYLDVDRFKELNDEHGHPSGDRALRAVAAALAEEARDSDVAGRTGGDEFAALLVHSDPDLGPRFVSRVQRQVGELGGTPGLPPTVSISAGFAHYPSEAASAEALFELADARLYEAKRSRKS